MSHVTEQQLRGIGDRSMPRATATYQPVSHGDALDYVRAAVERAGLTVRRDERDQPIQSFELARDGQRAWGTMDFAEAEIESGVGFMIGWRNSYDKSMSLSIAGGERVFVCSNGMIVAELILFRKHTTNILHDLPLLIDRAIDSFGVMRDRQAKLNERFRDVSLTDSQANDLSVHMALPRFGVEAITTGEISHVIDEWHEPSFDHGDKTVWRYKNALTEISKRIASRNGLTAADRNVRAARFLEKTFGADLQGASVTGVVNLN